MPLNRLELFAEKLSRLLDPGETALFLGTAMYVACEEQFGPDRPRVEAGLNPVDIVLGLGTPFERGIMTSSTAGRW
jgi:hydrogenase maturation factor